MATRPKARKTLPTPSSRRKSPAALPKAVPVVGIGASAGGLEALELFFAAVPARTGLAFVIVQHLDPNRPSLIVDLLRHKMAMKITEATDRLRVKPDCAYVIPPNREMTIRRGLLHLTKPAEPEGPRLSIDHFLRSLAADLQDRSIGVILSGMGSDGTLGLRMIKENAGLVLVQEPSTAKFNGMPQSAVDAGLADIVAPAEELPRRLLALLGRTRTGQKTAPHPDNDRQAALEKIIHLLRVQSGHDFSQYKKSTICRRIERRIGLHRIANFDAYARYLRDNPKEVELLFNELLIGVTNFFRDPSVWNLLREQALPALLRRKPPYPALRAWVAGCSTGEEAYSLAMAFREAVDQRRSKHRATLQIFATDLDRAAIDRARQGFYPLNIAADVTPQRLDRFFVKEETGYRVKREIREMVTFAQQNLIMDPPFTRLDIVSCRNLLIYLEPELQRKLIRLFHYSLNPRGLLLLGSAETIGNFGNLFSTLNTRARLYQRNPLLTDKTPGKLASALVPSAPPYPAQPAPRRTGSTFQAAAEHLILQRLSPATVFTNDRGEILFTSGPTEKYLEPPAGRLNWNLFAMARESLRYELVGALQKVLRKKEPIVLTGLQNGQSAVPQLVDVTLRRLDQPAVLRGLVLITFVDSAKAVLTERPAAQDPSSPKGINRDLDRKLRRTEYELQQSREQMQTAQEELRSTAEEFQSTNEELQSTNEELTTSKEELQSLNEELQTVNAELHLKVDELSRSNNDMTNLLNSTDIATVFLDKQLRVRRFTTEATKLIKLIPSDIGRLITDFSSTLEFPSFADDARAVLRSLNAIERRVANRDGRWFKVRIMPYRTLDNLIDGLVITFADATDHTSHPAPSPSNRANARD